MHLGIDLGTYTQWKRGVFNMFGCYVDMDALGWPTKLLSMGMKLFEQMTLSQFYGWLKCSKETVTIEQINLLISKLGRNAMRDRVKNIENAIRDLSSPSQSKQCDKKKSELERVQSKLSMFSIVYIVIIYNFLFYLYYN